MNAVLYCYFLKPVVLDLSLLRFYLFKDLMERNPGWVAEKSGAGSFCLCMEFTIMEFSLHEILNCNSDPMLMKTLALPGSIHCE